MRTLALGARTGVEGGTGAAAINEDREAPIFMSPTTGWEADLFAAVLEWCRPLGGLRQSGTTAKAWMVWPRDLGI